MNYKRIYAEFIADRLGKQPRDGQYFEVHHIKPRCMGGGDEPSNLIRLTAADHMFAHNVLARAYKDTQYAFNLWGAVLVLARDTLHGDRVGKGGKRLGSLSVIGVKGIKLRKFIDAARARRIEDNSGNNSAQADKSTYTFRNESGDEFVGTRVDFCRKYQKNTGQVARLVADEWSRTKDGWYVVDETKTDEDRARESDPKKYTFTNVAVPQRATYKGTRLSFKRYTGLDWWLVHQIVDNRAASPGGWLME
ncbi:homing endonuclease [Rhizobium phage 16-3]|uniref:homing endonuclease n=1 Tax=Rhizobium phage 16-3 TaxID=10704 RepID=UPI00017BA665|nr:homing endonuclease [Rhizobium phage 16-3]ABF71363.1 homing endonuclease [Rhizobium phage 16-3]